MVSRCYIGTQILVYIEAIEIEVKLSGRTEDRDWGHITYLSTKHEHLGLIPRTHIKETQTC